MIKKSQVYSIPCYITLVGVLKEEIEYDVSSKIYTELTWPDFDRLEH